MPQGSGRLSVVATPIGNLEDCSPRAIRMLREADGILCEDTRVTLKLLQALGVSRTLTGVLERSDQHSSESALDGWVARMLAGESLVLVSDAGTPAISDPGAELVSKCAEAGVPVTVIPGPSALTAFLSGAGFTEGAPVFRGFFPRKISDQKAEWDKVSRLPFQANLVWFESPERIEATCEFLASVAGELPAVISKELTKHFEKFYRGSLTNLTSHIQSARELGEIRGEWVIGVSIPPFEKSSGEFTGVDWRKVLAMLIRNGVSASRAAKEVSHVFGITKKTVYAEAVITAKSAVTSTDEAAEEDA
ncbi:MAG: 16S rRNA (cytidine(1402)-2'-O)-methyltransferase [Cryobacterium sp.]|nr:16S rRNA (cytidine(1402)-2'-O)-methyltransferase [Oligoflexia bacterium]